MNGMSASRPHRDPGDRMGIQATTIASSIIRTDPRAAGAATAGRFGCRAGRPAARQAPAGADAPRRRSASRPRATSMTTSNRGDDWSPADRRQTDRSAITSVSWSSSSLTMVPRRRVERPWRRLVQDAEIGSSMCGQIPRRELRVRLIETRHCCRDASCRRRGPGHTGVRFAGSRDRGDGAAAFAVDPRWSPRSSARRAAAPRTAHPAPCVQAAGTSREKCGTPQRRGSRRASRVMPWAPF